MVADKEEGRQLCWVCGRENASYVIGGNSEGYGGDWICSIRGECIRTWRREHRERVQLTKRDRLALIAGQIAGQIAGKERFWDDDPGVLAGNVAALAMEIALCIDHLAEDESK